jgi:tetratricopeptide (TPR) repeat protein
MLGRGADRAGLRREVEDAQRRIRQLAGATDARSVRDRGLAFWDLGSSLKRLGRHEAALAQLREAEAAFRELDSGHDLAVSVRIERARVLFSLERYSEARVILESLFAELDVGRAVISATFDPDTVDLIAIALNMWLYVLENLGCAVDAGIAADKVISSLSPGVTPAERTAVGDAFFFRGVAMRQRGESDQALAAFRGALIGAREPTAARAMLEQASLLAEIGRTNEALDACRELLARFGPGTATPMEHEAATAAQLMRQIGNELRE